MVEIKKEKDGNGYDKFKITTDEGSFNINFGGTLDLYWSYWPKEKIKNWPESKTFTITKENYFLYQKIEELYIRIKEKNPFPKIEPEEDTTFLEEFNLEDINNLDKEDYAFPTFSVRFRNSGSRYEPYNFTFMNMYNGLCEYDSDYHQIHIEEYLYHQKAYQKLKK